MNKNPIEITIGGEKFQASGEFTFNSGKPVEIKGVFMIAEVFLKSREQTPVRFWEYALRTEDKHKDMYEAQGFYYSKKHTEKYLNFSKSEKQRAKFTFINGIKQFK